MTIIGKYGKKYTPADGVSYLENLRYHFNGTVLRATDIIIEK